MDNSYLRQMAWMTYAFNQAMVQIKRDMVEIGWHFEQAYRESNGLWFLFRRDCDGLGYVLYKEIIADAVAWDYFDTWWEDELKTIKNLKLHRRKTDES